MSAKSAVATFALTVLAAGVSAQEGGQRLTGVFTQTVDGDTNFALDPVSEGDSFRSTTALEVEYLTETRTQTFRVRSDVAFLALRDADGSTDTAFRLPSVDVRYTQRASRASLDVGAAFSEVPLEFLRAPVPGFGADGTFVPVSASDDFSGTGDRQRISADVALRFGIDTPLTTTLTADVEKTDYIDPSDPDLSDELRYSASIASSLQLSRVLSADVSLSGSRTEEDDAADSEGNTLALRTGLTYDVNENLSTSAGISYVWRETIEAGTRTEANGVAADVGLSYTLENSSFGARLGLERTTDDETVTTGGLDWTYTLPRSTVRAGLDRSLTFGDGDDEALTSASVDVTRTINSISSASVGLSYSLSENLSDDSVPNEERFTFNAGYRRALSEDATLNLGYAYRREEDDPTSDAESHSLSLSISIPFDF